MEKIRDYSLLDKDIEDLEERMRTLLFRNERRGDVGRMIKNLWDLRKQLLDEIEEKKKKDTRIKNQQTATQGCKREKGKKPGKQRKTNTQLKVVDRIKKGNKKVVINKKKKKTG